MILDKLGIKHGTDKSSLHHNYLHIYESYFKDLRDNPFNLLEIGWGGYKFIDRGGQSAYMWLEYFSKAKINIIEFYKKEHRTDDRLKLYHGSQDDREFLNEVNKHAGLFDIIIDDGSHINPLTIKSFEILFPLLKSGGIYVIEDTETSYWSAVATDGTDFKGSMDSEAHTVMNYFKSKCDLINLANTEIAAIHFYTGLIFIIKK